MVFDGKQNSHRSICCPRLKHKKHFVIKIEICLHLLKESLSHTFILLWVSIIISLLNLLDRKKALPVNLSAKKSIFTHQCFYQLL